MDNLLEYILRIESHTICLYGEFCGTCRPVGSGILVNKDDRFYIISAHHVFDREQEQESVENDPDEYGIEHDDTDSVFIKLDMEKSSEYFRINDYMTGVVFTAYCDKAQQPIINEDTEYAVCHLTEGLVQCICDAGKSFYEVRTSTLDSVEPNNSIVISGFPQYAQNNSENIRTFKCEVNKISQPADSSLLRVGFDNKKAYSYKMLQTVQIRGIDGMSGGGIWMYSHDEIKPIGIILKQDPREFFIEGYRLDRIIQDLERN